MHHHHHKSITEHIDSLTPPIELEGAHSELNKGDEDNDDGYMNEEDILKNLQNKR